MSDKLIREAFMLSDSDFDVLMGPVKKAIAAFGKTVTASAKLIGNDVASFIKFTCYWKIRSLSSQKEIMKSWKDDRNKHLQTIYENQTAALESLGPDKYAVMCMCPGLFWSQKTMRGSQKLVGPETRQMIGEFGAAKLPIIGGIFGDQGYRGRSFWDRLASGDETPGTKESGEELRTELAGWLNDNNIDNKFLYPQGTGNNSGGGGGWKNVLYKINDIFMLGMLDHHEVHGTVLAEGDEDKKEKKDIMDDAEEILMEMLLKNYGDAMSKERTAYLEDYKKTFEGVVAAVEKVLAINIQLGMSDDYEQFFKILEDGVQKNKELKDIDVGKITEEFENMVKKLAGDEKVLQTLREELEKSGELKDLQEGEEEKGNNSGLTDKEKPIFEKHLRQIALDNVKGGFLNSLKEGVTDMYEVTMAGVSDGLSDESIQMIKDKAANDKIAQAYVDQIEEYQDRLNESISKLK